MCLKKNDNINKVLSQFPAGAYAGEGPRVVEK